MKKIIPILSAVCAALIAGAGVLGYFAYSWINPPAEPAVTPQRAGDVRGKVLTDSGAMTVAGIIVEDQQGNTSRYTTNAWGGYELSLLPGDYTLTFTKGYEYDTVTKQISISTPIIRTGRTAYFPAMRLRIMNAAYAGHILRTRQPRSPLRRKRSLHRRCSRLPTRRSRIPRHQTRRCTSML